MPTNIKMDSDKNLKITPNTVNKKNYKGENNFETLSVIYPKILDDKDLTQYIVQINIINQDNVGDVIDVVNPIDMENGFLKFDYQIPDEWTYEVGEILLWLKILNTDGIVGYTNEIKIPITDTKEISTFIPEQQLTLLDQWTIRMNEVEASALQAVEDAQEIADNISIDYNLSIPNKIGIKKNSETEFTYTNDLTGQQGIQGEDGLSAYQVWLAEGNVGNEQDFLDSLVGEQGEKGDDGYTPIKGTDYFTQSDIESLGIDNKVDKEFKTGSTTVYKVLSDNNLTNTLKNKLDGIAENAEVNVQADWNETDNTKDAFIKNKPTIPDISGKENVSNKENTTLDTSTTKYPTNRLVKDYVDTGLSGKQASGNYATLVNGLVPSSQLPSFVDDVLEYADFALFPLTGESGKIYVDLEFNLTYRWSGTAYVEISKSLALGETSGTAYRGDRGKAGYDHSQIVSGNPHGTTANDVGAEPTITTPLSPTTKYFRGDKTFVDFMTDVRDTVLTGISFVTNTAVLATDTVLQAIGKLQAQVTNLINTKSTLVSETVINTPQINATLTVDTTNDKITFSTNKPQNGTPLQFVANGGTLPAPFIENEVYYAYNGGASDIELVSTWNGTAKIDITSTGSGDWYIREAGVVSASIPIPDVVTNYKITISGKTALINAANFIHFTVNNSSTAIYDNNTFPSVAGTFAIGNSSSTDKYARFQSEIKVFNGARNQIEILGSWICATSTNDVTYTSRFNYITGCVAKVLYSTLSSFEYRGVTSSKVLLNGSKIILERVY